MTDESAAFPETSSLLQWLTQRYGDRLRPEQWVEVEKDIEGIVKQTQALRSVPLQNSDEPFTCFQPYGGTGVAEEGHTT